MCITSISRVYCNVNQHQPHNYSNYDGYEIQWNESRKYKIEKKIGRGKYSEVFEGINDNGGKVVLKILKPIKYTKIQREAKILEILKDSSNIIKLIDVVKDLSKIENFSLVGPVIQQSCLMSPSITPAFVFEHVNDTSFKELYQKLNLSDIQYYMLETLRGLEYCHSKGIMHRDVKPENIVYDHEKKKLRLIDWGLSEFYHPKQNYVCKVASLCYKSPELLVNYEYYNYSIDMWSVGCIFAALLFRKEPFFNGSDKLEQLKEIIPVVGQLNFEDFINKYNINFNLKQSFSEKFTKTSLSSFICNTNKNVISREAFDLLEELLTIDHIERISAEEAINHAFFSKTF